MIETTVQATRKYLRSIFPSLTVVISLFILPIALGVYFYATHYSEHFIVQTNLSYLDVQNSWAGQVFLEQRWLDWFNRFMDFALWGILAAVILVAVWMFSSARVTLHNHYATESFEHFSVPKDSWHGHFVVTIIIKILLVLTIMYSIISLVARAIPLLSANTQTMVNSFSSATVTPVLFSALLIVVLEYMLVTAIKTFRHLRAE